MSSSPASNISKREKAIPFIVSIALFMHLMDAATLATALPSIGNAFGVEAINLRSLITVYMLTIAIMVPASTWLSARFGARRTFLCAMLLFAIGSMLCAISDNQTHLTLARILQGCGGAMMTPIGRSIVVLVSRREYLVQAMASFSLPGVLAPMIGPPLAGLLIDFASWRWIFIINVPVCLIGVVCTLIFVPRIEEEAQRPFDAKGFALIAIGMTAFIILSDYVFAEGANMAIVAALGVASIGAAFLYVRHFRRDAHPVINLSLLRGATLRSSLWSGLLHRIAAGALPVLLSLQLQQGLGKSAFEAGQILLGIAVGALFARLWLGRMLGNRSLKSAMILWGGLSALTMAAPALFGFLRHEWFMLAVMIGVGFTRGIYFIPLGTIAYSGLGRDDVGQTTVLFTMAQQFSLALGVSFAGGMMALSRASGPDSFIMPYLAIGLCAALSIVPLMKLSHESGDDIVRAN